MLSLTTEQHHWLRNVQSTALASKNKSLERIKKLNEEPLTQCRYQHPGTSVRCTKQTEPGRAYCAQHL